MFKLTTLIENNSFDRNLEKEKGLSLLISNDTDKVIFDYGLSNKFWDNAVKLGFNPSIFNIGVVSHGHRDHVGGLMLMLQQNMFHTVYANEAIFESKFKKENNELTYIGIDSQLAHAKERFVFFNGVKEISKNIFAITDIGEGRIEEQYVDVDGDVDSFDDETTLVIKGDDGIHIVTGCTHKGVRAMLTRVKECFKKEKIVSLIGGLHIYDADYEVLSDTVNAIKEFKIKNLIVGHCTGENGLAYLEQQTDCDINLLYTGSTYILK